MLLNKNLQSSTGGGSVHMFGSCFDQTGTGLQGDKQKNWNPRSEEHNHNTKGVAALADIDMLRQGDVFVGSLHSNFVRMVHHLRYPNLNDSYHLIADDPFTADMENLHWDF